MALPVTTQVILGLAIAGSAVYMISAGDTEGVLEYIYVDKFVDAMPANAVTNNGTVKYSATASASGNAGNAM